LVLQARGIDVLVDGAHAPGMLPLNLDTLGAAYYTGNAHKWLCTPKGSAFLHVRRDRQLGMHPLVISHGYNATGLDRSRFQHEFGQTGTADATAVLCIPEALRFLTGLFGSMPALMAHNHALATQGRARLAQALGLALPCPADMLGSLATLVLPLPPLADPQALDPIQDQLWHDHGIEIPVISWHSPAFRGVRIAMQAYNDLGQVDRLAQALRPHLA
jgi:isopenicillin-N epimerase